MSERINWFPGHMAKALKEVKQKIKMVDLVIEVRDARIPLTSGNENLQEILGQKPRLIVLNKANLAENAVSQKWKDWFQQQGQKALFVNALQPATLKQVTQESRKLLTQKWQRFIKKGIKPPPMRMIIVGVPNTGKSTIINRLTKRNAANTGDRPGVTRSQEWIVLGKDMELLDTPGIMPPRIETEKQGLWLCSIHAIKDTIVGKEQVAVFVVDQLIKRKSAEFKKRYQLDSLDHNAEELILSIGARLNYKKKKGEIDYQKTCSQILIDYRKGLLGPCTFEEPPLAKPVMNRH